MIRRREPVYPMNRIDEAQHDQLLHTIQPAPSWSGGVPRPSALKQTPARHGA
jgi:hypothetical protein